MSQLAAALICIILMLIMLNTGLPIAIAVGFSSMIVGFAMSGPVALEKLGWTTYQVVFNPSWTPLPLFMFIGCLIAQTRIGEDLFGAARLWLSRLPGGLIVSSIMGQAAMGAVLGGSPQTILAIGPIAMPELDRYKYDRKLSLGALVTGGVLGPLIPPSGTMIVLSGLGNISLGPLLVAGLVPGILLAVMLSIVPVARCIMNPSLGTLPGDVSWGDRFSSLKRVWPVALTFIVILGSIFFGVATATEAGGVGAFVVLIIAITVYGIRGKEIYKAMVDTAIVNATILFIIVGAGFFSYIVGSSSLGRQMADVVTTINNPIVVIIAIMVILLILGCVIDGMTIMMIVFPIFLPLITSMGFEPIWFAVLFAVNMEIGLITPPMGINFFLVRNVFKITSSDLFRGTWPYMIMLLLFLLLLILFPAIPLWLPGLMLG